MVMYYFNVIFVSLISPYPHQLHYFYFAFIEAYCKKIGEKCDNLIGQHVRGSRNFGERIVCSLSFKLTMILFCACVKCEDRGGEGCSNGPGVYRYKVRLGEGGTESPNIGTDLVIVGKFRPFELLEFWRTLSRIMCQLISHPYKLITMDTFRCINKVWSE